MKGWVEIFARVYGGYLGRYALASLAPCIMRCAERLANKSFPLHGVQVVGREEILSYCGGILTGAPLLRSFVEESLRSEGLDMRLLPVRCRLFWALSYWLGNVRGVYWMNPYW